MIRQYYGMYRAGLTLMKKANEGLPARRARARRTVSASTEAGNKGTEEILAAFLQANRTTAERINAVQTALDSPFGKNLRVEFGNSITRLIPLEFLVPDVYRRWRPLVRDAMRFVVMQLSSERLAPKVVEQLELPADIPPESRLLRLIAQVPGLQKIGQVLARNRELHPALRQALSMLENGISDVTAAEVREIIAAQLPVEIEANQVKIEGKILAEASVGAVVSFTWHNPQTRRREAGVFKVMKPHVPKCYAEDMKIIQQLTGHLTRKHRGRGFNLNGLAETLTEIRLLLEREVDFRGEQATLSQVARFYESTAGVRIPRVIGPLCTDTITALTKEKGSKVTDAVTQATEARARIAERLAESLLAAPAFAIEQRATFHADPHAGNLLYDERSRCLVILDWALTDSLSKEQRRELVILSAMMLLRDIDGVCRAIDRLRERRTGGTSSADDVVRKHVEDFLGRMPVLHVPGMMDGMRLLEKIGLEGVRFPAALLMLRKASFTLEGVLEDIAGSPFPMDWVVPRYALTHPVRAGLALWSLLSLDDWVALDWSALTFGARVCATAVRQWLTLPATWVQEPAH
jgi:ubiquinone biosynthesis protein